MKKIIIPLLIVIVVIVLGAIYFNSPSTPGTAEPTPPASPQPGSESMITVEMMDTGFSPNEITVKPGTSVRFVNTGNQPHWPASAMHPTHGVYAGDLKLDIKDCSTDKQALLFDSCRGLAKGQSWDFTFNKIGTWRYHDHLSSTLFGKVIVAQ